MSVTASPSASLVVAVATSVSSVAGVASLSETVAVGGEFTTVTVPDVTAGLVRLPSLPVTRSAICSPRSPLPEIARSSVEAFAPGMAIPFLIH